MSEYQYYEFAAIDRPLTAAEMTQLCKVSTRGQVSASGFVNHYEWGGLKADPADWMRRYFDAFVYMAHWCSCRLSLRLPLGTFRKSELKPFAAGGALTIEATYEHWIIDWSLDPDLLAAAAAAAGSHRATSDDSAQAAAIDPWLAGWSREEMAAMLKLIALGQGREAERQIRTHHATWLKAKRPRPATPAQQRSVAQLRELAQSASGVRRARQAQERATQEARPTARSNPAAADG